MGEGGEPAVARDRAEADRDAEDHHRGQDLRRGGEGATHAQAVQDAGGGRGRQRRSQDHAGTPGKFLLAEGIIYRVT